MSRWEMVRRKTFRVLIVVLVVIIAVDLVAGGLTKRNPEKNAADCDSPSMGEVPSNVKDPKKEAIPQKASDISDVKVEAGRQKTETEESELLVEYKSLLEQGYDPNTAVEKVAYLRVMGEFPTQDSALKPVAEIIPEEAEEESEGKEENEKTVTVELLAAKTENAAQAQVATAEEVLRELEKSGRIGEITEQSTTSDRIWWIFKFLIGEGFTPESAAAVIGNVAIECCFDPTVISSLGYYGLFQWNNSSGGGYWWTDISAWLADNDYAWDSFEGQMKAFLYCSNRGFLTNDRLAKLKGMTNVEEAVEYFCVFYEGCVGGTTPTTYYSKGTCYQGLDSRKSEAWIAYYMYVNGLTEYTGNKGYMP